MAARRQPRPLAERVEPGAQALPPTRMVVLAAALAVATRVAVVALVARLESVVLVDRVGRAQALVEQVGRALAAQAAPE